MHFFLRKVHFSYRYAVISDKSPVRSRCDWKLDREIKHSTSRRPFDIPYNSSCSSPSRTSFVPKPPKRQCRQATAELFFSYIYYCFVFTKSIFSLTSDLISLVAVDSTLKGLSIIDLVRFIPLTSPSENCNPNNR